MNSLREDVYEDDNLDIIGYIPTDDGELKVFYAPNCETQGPRYFLVVTANEDGSLRDDSKCCRILEDKPEYLMGVDGKDSKLNKKEKELLIDFFSKGGDVRWSVNDKHPISGWEGYLLSYNNDKQAGCFAELLDDDVRHFKDTVETKPMPNYSLLETED